MNGSIMVWEGVGRRYLCGGKGSWVLGETSGGLCHVEGTAQPWAWWVEIVPTWLVDGTEYICCPRGFMLVCFRRPELPLGTPVPLENGCFDFIYTVEWIINADSIGCLNEPIAFLFGYSDFIFNRIWYNFRGKYHYDVYFKISYH